jgi:hypothetical protein
MVWHPFFGGRACTSLWALPLILATSGGLRAGVLYSFGLDNSNDPPSFTFIHTLLDRIVVAGSSVSSVGTLFALGVGRRWATDGSIPSGD